MRCEFEEVRASWMERWRWDLVRRMPVGTVEVVGVGGKLIVEGVLMDWV